MPRPLAALAVLFAIAIASAAALLYIADRREIQRVAERATTIEEPSAGAEAPSAPAPAEVEVAAAPAAPAASDETPEGAAVPTTSAETGSDATQPAAVPQTSATDETPDVATSPAASAEAPDGAAAPTTSAQAGSDATRPGSMPQTSATEETPDVSAAPATSTESDIAGPAPAPEPVEEMPKGGGTVSSEQAQSDATTDADDGAPAVADADAPETGAYSAGEEAPEQQVASAGTAPDSSEAGTSPSESGRSAATGGGLLDPTKPPVTAEPGVAAMEPDDSPAASPQTGEKGAPAESDGALVQTTPDAGSGTEAPPVGDARDSSTAAEAAIGESAPAGSEFASSGETAAGDTPASSGTDALASGESATTPPSAPLSEAGSQAAPQPGLMSDAAPEAAPTQGEPVPGTDLSNSTPTGSRPSVSAEAVPDATAPADGRETAGVETSVVAGASKPTAGEQREAFGERPVAEAGEIPPANERGSAEGSASVAQGGSAGDSEPATAEARDGATSEGGVPAQGGGTIQMPSSGDAVASTSGNDIVVADVAEIPPGSSVGAAQSEGDTRSLAERASAETVDPKEVTIQAAEAEAGDLYVAGEAAPGTVVQVYANNELVGAATAGAEGRWLVEGTQDIAVGEVTIRADATVGDENAPSAQAEAAFVRNPDGVILEPLASAVGGAEASVATAYMPVPTYVLIRRGDNLWRIAKRNYGRGVRYQAIFEANSELIRDPDLIYPGQVFVVPTRDVRWETAIN